MAGTLVHTREGLRPIEKIQVGNYVLSKPESGYGPEVQLTRPGAFVLLANGAPASMGSPIPILKGLEPDLGVLFRDTEDWAEDDCSGTTVRFGAHGVENVRGETYLREARHAWYD